MACSKGVDRFQLRTGPYAGECVLVDGPEYETVAGCGSNLGIFNPRDIIELNFYCDTYGIDTISFGTLTAFVMECYEAGILDPEKTGGLELRSAMRTRRWHCFTRWRKAKASAWSPAWACAA